MKTHDHGNARAAQRRAVASQQSARSRPVAQQAEHGEAATFDHQMNHSPRLVAQRQLLSTAFGPVAQREPQGLEEEFRVQAKQAESGSGGTVQTQTEVPTEANLTGMPNQLKSGIAALSGMAMSDVRVHRNSDKPAQLNALAYAQGNEIHLGPGQEQHLPHEAWHLVQQRQGQVRPTMQMVGVAVNDEGGLEREADVMGGRAFVPVDALHSSQRKIAQHRQIAAIFGEAIQGRRLPQQAVSPHIAQRVKIKDADYDNEEIWKWVSDELEDAQLPKEVVQDLKCIFDDLPEEGSFAYFADIAKELIEKYNKQTGQQLTLERSDERGEDESSSRLVDIIFTVLKMLTWLLMAQVVFQNMMPIVSATPLARRTESDPENDDLRTLPEMSPDDQLALTPTGYFGALDEPPRLLFQNLDMGSTGPRGGTRTDIDQPRDHNDDGMSLRDYIIWSIFSSRRNFGELPKVPRQDMTLMDWLVNGPSWLYLPYTKYSPTEVAVFVKNFHIKPALSMIPVTLAEAWTSTMKGTANRLGAESNLLLTFTKEAILRGGYYSLKAYIDLFNEMTATNQEARSFRSDLSADPWIKNSYRHAFWMCSYARKWTSAFASDLGYAHEYAHLDMTIEGPYDSLIDKINNFWGVRLADHIDQDCGVLVNHLGDQGYLAWAKDYKLSEASGLHLPTLHNIQGPLDALWLRYNELPAFNEYDLNALRSLRVQLPGQEKSSPQIEEID